MKQITLRVPDRAHEALRYHALVENRSVNNIMVELLEGYLETVPARDLESVKKAVAQARARGRRSAAESKSMAQSVAELDVSEGLGPIRPVRRKRQP